MLYHAKIMSTETSSEIRRAQSPPTHRGDLQSLQDLLSRQLLMQAGPRERLARIDESQNL